VIRDAIYGGSAQISGNFKEQQARDLASVLENPLATPVKIAEEHSASTSLGTTRAFGCSIKWAGKEEQVKAWLAKADQEPVGVELVDAAGIEGAACGRGEQGAAREFLGDVVRSVRCRISRPRRNLPHVSPARL
jgi:hypothetical protein